MTREEAIKWVDDRMCWGRGTFTKNHPPNIDECWEAGCMAIKALKSDRPKGEWIPCSERLPEESGKYLITANDGIHKRTTVAKYQNRHKTWEMTGRMAFWKVLAWMPMPSPWKGDK